MASFFVYTLFLISLIDTQASPTWAHTSTWTVALILEAILLAASAIYPYKHRESNTGNPEGGRMKKGMTRWEAVEIILDTLRITFLLALNIVYALFVTLRLAKLRQTEKRENGSQREITSLLDGRLETGTISQEYGTTSQKEKISG